MNSDDYFKKLEQNLKSLDKKRRNEIIQELKAISENESYDNLIKRFDEPEVMAGNYLEEESYKKTKKSKFLLYVLFTIIALFFTSYIFLKLYLKDPFDFSKYDENNITNKINKQWINVENVEKLDIKQSKVIIYFTKNDEFKYTCDDKSVKKDNNIFYIRQSFCYLTLPTNISNLKIDQSNVVLIKPLKSLDINAQQSSIEFASKDKDYDFILENESSEFKNFTSKKGETKIKLKLYQSNFEKYKY